jgi:hypothetical protein
MSGSGITIADICEAMLELHITGNGYIEIPTPTSTKSIYDISSMKRPITNWKKHLGE